MTEFFNEQDVRKFYRILGHKQETEIRLLDPKKEKRPISEFVNSEDAFVAVCKKYNGIYNIYAGLHERIHKGTEAEDVINVKTIVIDIDALRVDNKQPATDQELLKAESVAEQIKLDALEMKWEKPISAMTGNGYQVYFFLPEIEINDSNRWVIQDKLQQFQREMKRKYSRFAQIDNIGDLPRIVKVIGTKSIKGMDVQGRPHRLSFFVEKNVNKNEDSKLLNYLTSLQLPDKIELPTPELTNI